MALLLSHSTLLDSLSETIRDLDFKIIPESRKANLHELVNFIQAKFDNDEPVRLNFICTHNSRRSQMAQIWAKTAACYYGFEIESFSGGMEETSFNENAAEALGRAGFRIVKKWDDSPVYFVFYSTYREPLTIHSKLFNDPENPSEDFAAIMTCSDADNNCPFIPGADVRIPLKYADPKMFDDTEQTKQMYDDCSWQIATELFYVFSLIQ